jgi:hypothetical protein
MPFSSSLEVPIKRNPENSINFEKPFKRDSKNCNLQIQEIGVYRIIFEVAF